MTTATNLIVSALRKISSNRPGAGIDGNEAIAALDALNFMLQSWSDDGLLVPFRTIESFSLVVGQASYTIGTGGNFSTTRPDIINDIWYRDANNIDVMLKEITRKQYDEFPLKTQQGIPCYYFYDTQYPLAKLYIYPTADTANTLYIDSEKPFTALTSTASTINLPGQYNEAIIYNLAVRLAPEYGYPLTDDVRALAMQTLSGIRSLNAKTQVSDFDPLLVKKRYWNIYNGL
jgi:hypothetical protein